ncbi:hypothetical protein DFJ74DRAFT_663599 [Hyaloraphidium curvatum]|nr:hypothetical protein DFJ74DRAFT_663599 [Hyaloraphidium curvatum]
MRAALASALLALLVASAAAQDPTTYECNTLGDWLRQRKASGMGDIGSTPDNCCAWDYSALSPSGGTRKASCNAASEVQVLTWRGELNGTFNFAGLSPKQTLDPGQLSARYETIDLSGNPNLHGPIIPGSPSTYASMKSLNLSNSGLSGRLPRMDAWMPQLTSFDVSNTFLTGFLPQMPSGLAVCRIPPSVCYYADAPWTASTPKACLEGLPQCQGTYPAQRPDPTILPPLRPHWGDVPDPLSANGLATIRGQCQALLTWLTAHGASINETEFMEFAGNSSCCGWGVAGPNLKRIYCARNDQAIVRLELQNMGLTGDAAQPPDTMAQIKALGILRLDNNRLTGFPSWILNMSDIGQLLASNCELTGPVPNLTPLESLTQIWLTNNSLTGPIPAVRGVTDNYCFLNPQRGAGPCYQNDPQWSEPTCLWGYGNRWAEFCTETVPSVPDVVQPQTDWACVKTVCGENLVVRRVWSFQQGITIQCKGDGNAPYGTNRLACQFYSDDKCTVPTTITKPQNRRLASRAPADDGPVCMQEDTYTESSCMCPCANWCAAAWESWGQFQANSTAATTATASTATVTGSVVPTSPATTASATSVPATSTAVPTSSVPATSTVATSSAATSAATSSATTSVLPTSTTSRPSGCDRLAIGSIAGLIAAGACMVVL